VLLPLRALKAEAFRFGILTPCVQKRRRRARSGLSSCSNKSKLRAAGMTPQAVRLSVCEGAAGAYYYGQIESRCSIEGGRNREI
jgi:hypothetical protein